MQLNKYNLGDVVMVQGKIRDISLSTKGEVTYTIYFNDDKSDYDEYATVPEELITTVF